MRPGKVLLIAEQANPEMVSVPLIGWSLAREITTLVDAHIVTQVRNRGAFSRAGLIEGENYTAIDSEYLAAPLNKLGNILRGGSGKGWTTVTAFRSLAYYAFEFELWNRFGSGIRAGKYSLVHQITPLSPTAPGILARRCHEARVPFFVGPLNGGLRWPVGFEARRRQEREWLSYLRGLYKLLPGARSKLRYAHKIFVASDSTASQIPQSYADKLIKEPENGVDLTRFSTARNHQAKLPIVGVFVGRLVPYKCPDLLIRAAAPLIREGKLRLRIVGDGPMREALVALAHDLQVTTGIEWLGWVKHRLVQDALATGDFLALPSIREFGGGVVLEAMACGLPVVVADYGGPAELVEEGAGMKVKFEDELTLEKNLQMALNCLVADPRSLDVMGAYALALVRRKHSWRAKAQRIIKAYELS